MLEPFVSNYVQIRPLVSCYMNIIFEKLLYRVTQGPFVTNHFQIGPVVF